MSVLQRLSPQSSRLPLAIVLLAVSAAVSSCNSPLLDSVQDVQHRVSDATAAEALNLAETEIGKPYVWAGRGPDEFDCSGLITWVYKQAVGSDAIFKVNGQTTTDATIAQLYHNDTAVLQPDEVKPGDIVYITDGSTDVTHGGLFISWITSTTFRFLDASSYYGKVVTDTWSTTATIRGQEFVAFGRLQLLRG